MSKVQQLELRWITPSGRINARLFRQQIGFQLGKADSQRDWSWLFNNGNQSVSPFRFYTANTRDQGVAGIIAVGDEACQQISQILPVLLTAARQIECLSSHPTVHTGQVYWEHLPYAAKYRAQTIVLPKLRGNRDFYDMHRANPDLLIPYLKEAIVKGINRMADRIGIPSPDVFTEQVQISEIGKLGTQPIHKPGGEALVSRVSHACFSLPFSLQGDWRVGGLLSYGNGRVISVSAERQYARPLSDKAQSRPFPVYRMAG